MKQNEKSTLKLDIEEDFAYDPISNEVFITVLRKIKQDPRRMTGIMLKKGG